MQGLRISCTLCDWKPLQYIFTCFRLEAVILAFSLALPGLGFAGMSAMLSGPDPVALCPAYLKGSQMCLDTAVCVLAGAGMAVTLLSSALAVTGRECKSFSGSQSGGIESTLRA